MTCDGLILAALFAAAVVIPAHADVVISSDATQNINCANGICRPTANDATLNVGDLEALLASGSVEVTSRNRDTDSPNILIESALSSSSSHTLTLEGRTVVTEKPVSISGSGAIYIFANNIRIDGSVSISGTSTLSIETKRQIIIGRLVSIRNSGSVGIVGNLLFERNGAVTFADLSATVVINDKLYTLVDSLPSLAAAMAANPQGNFALANSYDAGGDGTYATSPIQTNFLGSFEGLGNAISNISVDNTAACCVGGLFLNVSQGSVADIRLTNVNVTSVQGAAGLVYESFGNVAGSSVTGSVSGGRSGVIAGLVGENYGDIEYGYSTAAVSAAATVKGIDVGGLVGVDYGSTANSFAAGVVSAGDGSGNVGGLIGRDASDSDGNNNPQDCYATGNVSGGAGLNVGGLIGMDDHGNGYGPAYCYSGGAVSGGKGSTVGGLIGVNNSFVMDDYWDTTTSGTDVGVGIGNASGVTGLTTTQLQSGLPAGFAQNIWHENAKINNGLPYLVLNPPPN